jgi:hypothetical protein
MKIQFPLARQALMFGLALVLLTGCLAPLPTPVPGSGVVNLNVAPTPAAPTQPAANTPSEPTPSPAPPTPTVFVTPASDLTQLPDPLEGWQSGNPSAPITLAEYGDFQ